MAYKEILYTQYLLRCSICGNIVSEYNSGLKFLTDFPYGSAEEKFKKLCLIKHIRCKQCGHILDDIDFDEWAAQMNKSPFNKIEPINKRNKETNNSMSEPILQLAPSAETIEIQNSIQTKQLLPITIYAVENKCSAPLKAAFGEYPQEAICDKNLIKKIISEGTTDEKDVYTLNGVKYYVRNLRESKQLGPRRFEDYPNVFFSVKSGPKQYLFQSHPILWNVYDRDNYLLFVSANVIESGFYFGGNHHNFNNSYIKDRLNTVFYSRAFNKKEQEYISTVKILNPSLDKEKNPSSVLLCDYAKIFLLSYDEALNINQEDNRKFGDSISRTFKSCLASDYASVEQTSKDRFSSYWLRKTQASSSEKSVPFINDKGELDYTYGLADLGIRPCFYIKKSLVQFVYDEVKAKKAFSSEIYMDKTIKENWKTVPSIKDCK